MTTLTRENKLTAPTRNSHVAWTGTNPVVPEGVLIIVKDRLYVGSVEYAIGDGVSNYNALRKFGEAKDANGKVPAERLYITGALAEGNIIESGENANGRYVKWADGTMICTALLTNQTLMFNVSMGGFYRNNNFNVAYPAAFVDIPYIDACAGIAETFLLASARAISRTYTELGVFHVESSTLSGINVVYLAIGRWKA